MYLIEWEKVTKAAAAEATAFRAEERERECERAG